MEIDSEPRDVPLAFGPFEWRAEGLELRRKGVRVRLSRQPAEILQALLLEPGRLVTRDELRGRLWGEDTFVDFEQGLNTAVARLRQALRDSADDPRYVETVPGRGYRFIGDLHARTGAAAPPEPASENGAGWSRRAVIAGGVGALAGAAGSWLLGGTRGADRSAPRGRFVISGPPGPPLTLNGFGEGVAISPDGLRVAYGCRRDGSASIYLRAIDETEGRYLPGTDIYAPFFSPDGMEIGYYRFPDQSLLRVSSLGGAAAVVASGIGVFNGASWSTDGSIVFGARFANGGLMRVAAGGGAPEPVTKPPPGVRHILPEVLPDGRAALFTIALEDGSAPWEIAVVDLETGELRSLVPGSSPRLAATGHLLFVLEDRLMAVELDAARRAVTGTPRTVMRGIATSSPEGVGQYALSRGGTLVLAVPGSASREAVWVGRDGSEAPIAVPAAGLTYPRVSPDGRRVALDVRDGDGGQIVVWDFERARLTGVSRTSGLNLYGTWSRDGEQIAFYAARPVPGLYLKTLADAGEPVLWSRADELRALYFFTPSGRDLVFARQSAEGVQLCSVPLRQGAEPVVLLENARNADLSPDGRRLVYQTDEEGRFETYVRAWPSLDRGYHRLSTNGGVQPVWSPRGDEVFYIEPGSPARLMSIAMGADPESVPEAPAVVMDWPYRIGELGRTYDVSRPGGERFIAIKEAGALVARAEVVLGWHPELESAPTSR